MQVNYYKVDNNKQNMFKCDIENLNTYPDIVLLQTDDFIVSICTNESASDFVETYFEHTGIINKLN